MSEYQYYEFQAIDRPLTKAEMAQLRSISSRADITPTSFTNEYSYGDFRGDADALMEKHFDAFLYLANWGTRTVKLRLPAQLLDLDTARQYCGESVTAREKNGRVILTFVSEEEEGGGEWVEGKGQLSELISVRSELAIGDLRALYLGWLLCAQNGELDDDVIEPPVPAGLGQRSASLRNFADYFRLDPDLIEAAAAVSAPLIEIEPTPAEIRAWIARLPISEKDDLLLQSMTGSGGAVGNELVQRMRREKMLVDRPDRPAPERRTVAMLLRSGKQAAQERKQKAAAKAAQEKAKRERLATLARAMHLKEIAGQEPALWQKVADLIAFKQPKTYDQAVEILKDLRDLAAPKDDSGFRRQVEALRAAHGGKRTLIERLDKAGLA